MVVRFSFVFVLLLTCSSALWAQEVWFVGVPTTRTLSNGSSSTVVKLDAQESRQNVCKIVRKKKRYYWASRNNAELRRIDGDIFVYFVSSDGGGYVKIFAPEIVSGKRKLGAFDPNGAHYLEQISIRLSTITYWGRTAQGSIE